MLHRNKNKNVSLLIVHIFPIFNENKKETSNVLLFLPVSTPLVSAG